MLRILYRCQNRMRSKYSKLLTIVFCEEIIIGDIYSSFCFAGKQTLKTQNLFVQKAKMLTNQIMNYCLFVVEKNISFSTFIKNIPNVQNKTLYK